MSQIKRIYISGLGAIGSSYASMLYRMNRDSIRVVADKSRIERYNKGVIVNNETYIFDFLEPDESADTADLVLIAVKQHHLMQSIKDISRFVGPNTIIMSFLNGITSEEIIGQAFGIDKLLYSFCVGIDAVRDGNYTRFTKPGQIVFGEKQNDSYSPKVTAVRELFDKAGIPYSIPKDMIRELWWKFMLNVGINQASAILKAPYRVFQDDKDAQAVMTMASREVVQVGRKIGINLDDGDISKSIDIICTLSPDGKTSMLQDVEAGRKTEVEIFAGTVIELGQKYGVDTPVNNMMLKMIHVLEKMQI